MNKYLHKNSGAVSIRVIVQGALRAAVHASSEREGLNLLADALRKVSELAGTTPAARTAAMSTQTETTMATIEAAVKVILTQMNHCIDAQTALEHIAYAAAIIGCQANAGRMEFMSSMEESHA